MAPVQIEVIINANSCAHDKEVVRSRLIDLFNASGIEARISLARTGAEVTDLAQWAVRNDAGTIVAAGAAWIMY